MGRKQIYSGTKKQRNVKAATKYRKTFAGYAALLISRIKQRCNNQYSGRGIKLCFTRVELLGWLKENNIDPRGLDIHRIEFNGNYTLGNIEFLTKSEHTILHNTRGH